MKWQFQLTGFFAIFVTFADPWIGIVIGLLLCFVLIDNTKPEKDIV